MFLLLKTINRITIVLCFGLSLCIPAPSYAAESPYLQDFLQKYEYARLARYYSANIEDNPSDPYKYFERAEFYYGQQEFHKAIEDCTKALNMNPFLAEAYYIRGASYYNLNNYDEAKNDFKKAAIFNTRTPGQVT